MISYSYDKYINLPLTYLVLPQLLKQYFDTSKIDLLTFLQKNGLKNIYLKDLVNDPLGKFDNHIFLRFNNKLSSFKNVYKRTPIITKEGATFSIQEYFLKNTNITEIYELDEEDVMIVSKFPKGNFTPLLEGKFSLLDESLKKEYYKFNKSGFLSIGNAIVNKDKKLIEYIEKELDMKLPEESELFREFQYQDYLTQ